MVGIVAPVLLRGDVTIHITPYPKACAVASLPRWRGINMRFSIGNHLNCQGCDYTFRAINGGVLAGLHCDCRLSQKPGDSIEKYAISLDTKKVRRATQSEWDQADPYLTFRVGADSLGRSLEAGQKVKYKGREFDKSGSKWPQGQDPSLVSANGNFLAVNSWDGVLAYVENGGLLPFYRDHLDGHYYVDFYNVSSGQHLLTLQGEFHGVDPQELFDKSGWISKSYYLLPLDEKGMRRFVLCDLRQVPEAVVAAQPQK